MKLRGYRSNFWFMFFLMSLSSAAQATRVLLVNQRIAKEGADKAMYVMYTVSDGKTVTSSMKPGEYADLDKVSLIKIFMHGGMGFLKQYMGMQIPTTSELPIKNMSFAVVRIVDEASTIKPYSIKVDEVSLPMFLAEKAKCTAGMTLGRLSPE